MNFRTSLWKLLGCSASKRINIPYIITKAAWRERSAFYSIGNASLCVTLFYSEKKKILREMLIFCVGLSAHRRQEQTQEPSMNKTSVHLEGIFCCKMLHKPAQAISCFLLDHSNFCSCNYGGKFETETFWNTKKISL